MSTVLEPIVLPYSKRMVRPVLTNYRYTEIPDIDTDYKGRYVRGRAIIKVDVLSAMTDVFSAEYLQKYRSIIYDLMSGAFLSDEEKVSKLLSTFYVGDETFRRFLGEIVYFNPRLDTFSLYSVIIQELTKSYIGYRGYLATQVGNNKYKLLAESAGYLYITVPDDGTRVRLPKVYTNWEVLSCVKVWNGRVEGY